VSWQVRTRAEAGWSDWSAAHEFETGLLDLADWHGRFIGGPGPGPHPPRGQGGALYLRRRFTVTGPPARARVYATARGTYELHLDGTRISDPDLTPGLTACRSHLEVRAYDITRLCGPGDHELIATVTGNSPALLAQVEIADRASGRRDIGTGSGWQATTSSPLSAADRMEVPGWRDAVVLDAPDARATPACHRGIHQLTAFASQAHAGFPHTREEVR
jgi:alpha-L-rhamnosidase